MIGRMVNERREGSSFHRQWPFSQGGPKRENPVMAMNTVTARRKGDPHHILRKKHGPRESSDGCPKML